MFLLFAELAGGGGSADRPLALLASALLYKLTARGSEDAAAVPNLITLFLPYLSPIVSVIGFIGYLHERRCGACVWSPKIRG